MIEFENAYLRLWVDNDLNLLYSEWQRPVSSQEYREGNLLLLQTLSENSVQNWIADSERLGDVSLEDQQWTLQELTPKFAQTKLTKLARIGGEDTGSHARFEQFMNKVEPIYIGNIQIRQFVTYKGAADWIGDVAV